jgi:hypothetical protein
MQNAPSSLNRSTSAPWAVTQAIGEWKKSHPTPAGKTAVSPRFDRATIGLILGGLLLGAAGCILGAVMPYRHPVAVSMSMIWWGFYCGCFGASVGALIGLLTRRPLAVSTVVPERTAKPARTEPACHGRL